MHCSDAQPVARFVLEWSPSRARNVVGRSVRTERFRPCVKALVSQVAALDSRPSAMTVPAR